jgi:1-acyl-sn-glycerol-3-phosphate acyltransferase
LSLAFHTIGPAVSVIPRLRFDVRVLTPRFELPPRSLLLVTHRSDWDVPLTANVYWAGRFWRRDPRLLFVARDDMFLPGFLGGYPPGLPRLARRALGRINVGPALLRGDLGVPIASATRARLADVRLYDPSLVPPADPERLWEVVERDDRPELAGFWAHRAAQARRDFRRLVEHVRGGGCLALYPEGRPSPDGAIGPLQRGLDVLIRRARPASIVVAGIAYDPLGPGRTRAYLALSPPLPPDTDVLAAMRATLPLTAGQLAAHELLRGVEPAPDGRPADPRLAAQLPAARSAANRAPRSVLERLDLELTSARGAAAPGTPARAAQRRTA